MESQSTDHDTTPATSERLMSGHQPASSNSIIATSSTCMELECSDHSAETNIIIQQDSSNTEALQSKMTPGDTKTCNTDNIENSSDSQNTTTVKDARATSVSEQGDPSTETEGVSDKISVNKDVPHADTSSGDTEMCSSHDLMETIGSQATTAESDRLVVVMKQEKGLESNSPQLTATSCNLVATDGRNSHAEVKKICETDQSDNIESANTDCIHITIKQEPSVAFHDLVCVSDGSNDERLDEGATEPSCYTLDYRGKGRKDSSSSVDSSDSDEVDSDDAREMHKAKTEKQKGAAEVLKTKGEITLENLPPLEELHIMLAEDVVMAEVGSVRSVIGPLVVVEAREGLPALNMDTILFLEGRKVMGQVFETFGPVASPFYSVRYNCESDIERLGIEPHQTVFYAPSESQYTHYIFLEQLTSLKGSDASWEDNNEPPAKFIDFSDDEEERRFKAKKRNKNKEGSADGDQEGKRKPQTKRKQDDHQRSRQGQGSGSMQPTTRQNGSQDGGMPPWRNTTPNPFSHMGRTPDRGSSGQHPPQELQQWPPPPSQMGDHSQFSSPPPRPPMFPGIDESSLSWQPYGPPRGGTMAT